MQRRIALVAAALLFTGAMVAAVPWATATLGPGPGYAAVFIVYWFGFLAPAGVAFGAARDLGGALSLKTDGARWVPWAVAVQVGLVGGAALALAPGVPPLWAIGLGLAAAAVNGFLEEFFWRGAFLAQAGGRDWFLGLGVALFGLWHVPLALAEGVRYEGGPAALIGGALALGAFWMVLARRTGRIGWPVLAHIFTNAATFQGLILMNVAGG